MGTEPALPSYEVEFIPLERRLAQRRNPFATANWRHFLYRATGAIRHDRREAHGRRADDVSAPDGPAQRTATLLSPLRIAPMTAA